MLHSVLQKTSAFRFSGTRKFLKNGRDLVISRQSAAFAADPAYFVPYSGAGPEVATV